MKTKLVRARKKFVDSELHHIRAWQKHLVAHRRFCRSCKEATSWRDAVGKPICEPGIGCRRAVAVSSVRCKVDRVSRVVIASGLTKEEVIHALEQCDWRPSKAALVFGFKTGSYKTFKKRVIRLGLGEMVRERSGGRCCKGWP